MCQPETGISPAPPLPLLPHPRERIRTPGNPGPSRSGDKAPSQRGALRRRLAGREDWENWESWVLSSKGGRGKEAEPEIRAGYGVWDRGEGSHNGVGTWARGCI